MPLRSRSVAGFANCQLLHHYRSKPISRTSSIHGALIRFNHSSTDPPPERPPWSRRVRRPEQRGKDPKKPPESQNFEIKSNFLGEPGKILVVPDRRRRKPDHRKAKPGKKKPSNDAENENDVPFMLSELGKQEYSVEDEEVTQRVEGFRSLYSPGAELSNEEWEKLSLKLWSSFTANQLAAYVSEHLPSEPLHWKLEGALEWMPGTSEFVENESAYRTSIAQRLMKPKGFRGKKFLAEQILRDCWRLGISAEVGQQDIRLPTEYISLFINSDNFSFDEIGSLNGANIKIMRAIGLVRITGTRAGCTAASDIINDATNRIREEDFEPRSRADTKFEDVFTPKFLEWVSKSYGVSFSLNSRNYPNKVFYLAENKGGADSARRTLNLATYKAPSDVPFCTYLSSFMPASIYTLDPESKISYFGREKAWFRWAMSATQSTEGEILATPFFDAHQSRLSDVLLNLLRKKSPAATIKGDAAGPHETVTAAVGKCLFMRKPSLKEDIATATELGEMSLPRVFITDVRRTTSFLGSLKLSHTEEGSQPHRIRLLPTAVNADVFPALDLEITAKQMEDSSEPGSKITLRSAKAILSENSVDFLLPENDLDLRFSRTIHYDLLNGSDNVPRSDQGIESLEETMNKSLRGIISATSENMPQVPLPGFCHISLPRKLLKQNPTASQSLDGSDDSSDFVSAEYMFHPVNDARGTQVHRYDFRGHPLNFSFYESGPFFADKTTDISIAMDLPERGGQDSQAEDLVKSDFSSFYNDACQLAFELDRAYRLS